jgi:hypothetical protein
MLRSGLSEPRQKTEAIHAGHLQIEQDYRWLGVVLGFAQAGSGQIINRRLPILDDAQCANVLPMQNCLQQLDIIRVVFDIKKDDWVAHGT